MNETLFDRLARDLARGVSRRQVLKGLVRGTVGGLLITFGWEAQRPPAGAYAHPQGDEGEVFLPLIMHACGAASTCNKRQYCSADQGCLCIRTAEGDIQCGKIPACDIQKCQTSADCASLGAGYFCDTPNSGCCDDAALARCIAPCTTPCPAERLCGTHCCAPNQACINGHCTTCPTERICGGTCCPAGQRCINGACAVPSLCTDDPITADSLAAASDALANGATEVALSPNGCQSYRRTLSNSRLTYEEMTFQGLVLLKWEHTATQAVNQIDGDLDGFFEHKTTIQYDTNLDDKHIERLEYDVVTRKLRTRQAAQRLDPATRHVIWSEADATGALQVITEFDAPVTQEANADPRDRNLILAFGPRPQDACTSEQLATILNQLREGIVQGVQCLRDAGMSAVAAQIENVYVTRRFTIVCESGTNRVAAENDNGFPAKPILMNVNVDRFFGPDGTVNNQRLALFHEMLHLPLGGHHPKLDGYKRYDRVYACHTMCFDSGADQCQCTTCLQAKTCDARCQAYATCKNGPTQCADQCCVGPCEGTTCCPPDRICKKGPDDTALCCPPNEQCFNKADLDSFCCKPTNVCGNPPALCCNDGEQCVQTSPGVYGCITPKLYCNCSDQCYEQAQLALCEADCQVGLGCFAGICGPAAPGQCP